MSAVESYIEVLSFLSTSHVIGNKNTIQLNQNSSVEVVVGNDTLVTLRESEMVLCDNLYLESKIQPEMPSEEQSFDIHLWKLFLQKASDSIVRLNHIGISYYSENVEDEIVLIKNVLEQSGLYLYEEVNDSPGQRWLFAGNADIWEAPMFEVVLTQKDTTMHDEWIPHIQMDFDTTLNIQEIKDMLRSVYSKDMIDWELAFDQGAVLGMGKLGEISGTKIVFGLGTNLRNTKYFRNNILRRL